MIGRIVNGQRGQPPPWPMLLFRATSNTDEPHEQAWCSLPSAGALVQYRARAYGSSADGLQGFYRLQEGTAVNDGGGVQRYDGAFVGPGGYPAGTPAGWACDAVLPGDVGVAFDCLSVGPASWVIAIEVFALRNGARLVGG